MTLMWKEGGGAPPSMHAGTQVRLCNTYGWICSTSMKSPDPAPLGVAQSYLGSHVHGKWRASTLSAIESLIHFSDWLKTVFVAS